jgi:hypothetical protein
MKMKSVFFVVGILLVFGLFASDLRAADYEITITNLTRGQVITPPLVFSHMETFMLFYEGEMARPALAQLAEMGATDPLVAVLKTFARVYDIATGSGPIPPGESLTVKISTKDWMEYITAVGMLAQTNDGFFAIKGVRAPVNGSIVVYAPAYDAGSEENNELSSYVPGPPFGGTMRSFQNREKFVHIHAGIQGIGDLMPSMYDWRNPVAKIKITRID